jgi:hypothetical protein
MLRRVSRISVLAGCALLGCGSDGPELAEVTGVVRLDGKPLPGAQLTFIPTAPGGSTAYGATDEEGRYELKFSRDRTGAMPGLNDVTIELPARGEIEALREAGLAVPPEGVKLPQKYQERGELTAEIKSGDNEIPFDLESK